MVFTFVRQLNQNLSRRIRRAFLAEPDKAPQRIAIAMASVLLLSIIVTYNVLYERAKRREGIQPRSVVDVFRERNAKQRQEHLELQQNIAQARERAKTASINDF